MSVLVVGGAGFVGSNLVLKLLENQFEHITVIDNLISSESFNIPRDKRVTFIQGSITNDDILSQVIDHFQYIFHLATYHGNQSSIHDPLADHENNTLTTLKLFNHIKDFKNIKKVVYSSAGCSVAEKKFGHVEATTEDDPIKLEQDSPYSISKIIGEFYSVYFHRQHKLPTVRARFQNVYGPREILGAGIWRGTPATVWRNVTPTFIYKAINQLPLPVENNGIATRDFIYVDDIAQGLLQCALNGQPGQVYNLASGRETSIFQLAQTINQLTQNKTPIQFLPPRPWDHSGNRFGSTLKSQTQLHFNAQVTLEEGLKRTIQWTKENMSTIQSCIQKHQNYMK